MKTNRKTIFIVEDQEMYANIIKVSIENKNTEVHIYSTGEECVANLNMDPDVIIMDYQLDDGSNTRMNGIDTLARIKQHAPNTEVVMLSGHDDVKVVTQSIKAGAYDYVVKNENAMINVKNRMKNIFKNMALVQEMKELKILRTGIIAIAVVACVFAIFSGDIMA